MTVHLVQYGMVACSMEMPPAKWPEEHTWSSDWADVTCNTCLAAKDQPPTFELLEQGKAIRCRACGRVSYNAKDIEHHYCARCHLFHDDLWPPARKRFIETQQAFMTQQEPFTGAKPVFVYPFDHPEQAAPATLLIESANRRSAAVAFLDKPLFLLPLRGMFLCQYGITLLLQRDSPAEFWQDITNPESQFGITDQKP